MRPNLWRRLNLARIGLALDKLLGDGAPLRMTGVTGKPAPADAAPPAVGVSL